jgi:hypothetical protein
MTPVSCTRSCGSPPLPLRRPALTSRHMVQRDLSLTRHPLSGASDSGSARRLVSCVAALVCKRRLLHRPRYRSAIARGVTPRPTREGSAMACTPQHPSEPNGPLPAKINLDRPNPTERHHACFPGWAMPFAAVTTGSEPGCRRREMLVRIVGSRPATVAGRAGCPHFCPPRGSRRRRPDPQWRARG